METQQPLASASRALSPPVRTRPLNAAIGMEILDVDLREDLSTQTFEAIRDAWRENCVILVRGQTLDEAAQVRFAQRFGELGKVLHQHDGRSSLPGVMYISNIRENGKLIGALPDGEMYFHSDQCYIENPSVGTMLYAMEVPSKGGDTIFANMFAAYDALPDDLKQKIEGRTALNVYDYLNAATVRGSEPKEGVPSFAHPMVKTHPFTGRKALYFNRLMTHHIVGMEARRERSAALAPVRSSGAGPLHLPPCVDAGRPHHVGQSQHAARALGLRRVGAPAHAPHGGRARALRLRTVSRRIDFQARSVRFAHQTRGRQTVARGKDIMIKAIARLGAAAAGAALLSASALAQFNDKKPISYSVDGATATGYFKVVTEAINGIVREAYPGTDATYKPGSPAGGILNHQHRALRLRLQRLAGGNPVRERRQGAFQGALQGQVPFRHDAARRPHRA